MAHGSRHSAPAFCSSICHRLPGIHAGCAVREQSDSEYACRALKCSTLIPSKRVDDKSTNDYGYRNGNEWWVDYVAGSLLWDDKPPEKRVVVALFDDGALASHVELRNQLWTNEAEANGKPGVDDDGNGYIDDVHGWDFVDDDGDVSRKANAWAGPATARSWRASSPPSGTTEQALPPRAPTAPA